MKPLLPILLLTSIAHADMLAFDLGAHPIDVVISATLPAQWAYAADGGLVQSADADGITGGAYFPDGDDHGWTILPAIPETGVASAPWAFEVLAANPAEWRIDIAGDAGPEWDMIGEVTGGFYSLERLADAQAEPLGNVAFVTDGGFVVMTDVDVTTGSILFAPEPTTLSLTVGAIFLSRKIR